MKVYRKSWPNDSFWKIYHIERSKADSMRYFGLKYWKGNLISTKVEKICGVKKRGTWQYEIDGAFEVTERDIQTYAAF